MLCAMQPDFAAQPDVAQTREPTGRISRHVRDWIFDLDNTLYRADNGIFAQIDGTHDRVCGAASGPGARRGAPGPESSFIAITAPPWRADARCTRSIPKPIWILSMTSTCRAWRRTASWRGAGAPAGAALCLHQWLPQSCRAHSGAAASWPTCSTQVWDIRTIGFHAQARRRRPMTRWWRQAASTPATGRDVRRYRPQSGGAARTGHDHGVAGRPERLVAPGAGISRCVERPYRS